MSMRIKSKDINNSLINVTQEVAANLVYSLDLINKNKFVNLNDLEMDIDYSDWFSGLRKTITSFKHNVKSHFERLGTSYCGDKADVIMDLFSPRRPKTIEKEWGIEDNRDIRKKLEDILLTILPPNYKRDYIPDDKAVDFKVFYFNIDKSSDARRRAQDFRRLV